MDLETYHCSQEALKYKAKLLFEQLYLIHNMEIIPSQLKF